MPSEGDYVSLSIPSWMARENGFDIGDNSGGEPFDIKAEITGESDKAYQVRHETKGKFWSAKSKIMDIHVLEEGTSTTQTEESADTSWQNYSHAKYDIDKAFDLIKHSPLSWSALTALVELFETYRKDGDKADLNQMLSNLQTNGAENSDT